jgi:glutathione transport system substrate-binding protein
VTEPREAPVARRSRISTYWRDHRARWTLPLVIIVIIGALAVIDHVDSQRIRQVDAPSPPALVAATGGSIAVHLDRTWSGFNPNTPAGAASSTTALLSSVLPSAYVVSPKLAPQINSDLLLSVEAIATSPLTIQYVINPAAVWSDGVPVSADDFVYAWQAQRGDGTDVDGSPYQVASSLGYDDIASVTGSHGGKTVTVVFDQPFTDWRMLFDHLLPAHVARVVGWNHGFEAFAPTVDLSAGPMVVQSASPNGTAVLVRNPKWWGTPSVVDRVDVTASTTPASWVTPLAAGNESVAQATSFDVGALSDVSSMPNSQSTVKASLSFLQLEFDVKSAPTDKVAVRQAVAHAIDRTVLLAKTFGAIDPGLVVSEDHLATPSQVSYDPSSASAEYAAADESVTDQLLKSAGYHQDPSGAYVDATGKPLSLRMAVETGDPWIGSVATELAAQLRSVGIGVTIVPVGGSVGMTMASAANAYDVALVTRVSTPFPTVTAGWYSQLPGSAGSLELQDWSKFDDPDVNQLYTQASQLLNPVTGSTLYAQIDDQLWDQMVALPLFEEPVLLANGVQVDNVQFNPSTDGLLWNVALWTTLKPGPKPQKT